MQKLDPGTGPNLGASQAGGESLRLRHRRTLASAALGTTASSIWRTQQIKKEKKRQKEKERKPARPVVVAGRCAGLSAGVDGVGGGDDLVVGWELRGLDSLLGSLDERIMARYS